MSKESENMMYSITISDKRPKNGYINGVEINYVEYNDIKKLSKLLDVFDVFNNFMYRDFNNWIVEMKINHHKLYETMILYNDDFYGKYKKILLNGYLKNSNIKDVSYEELEKVDDY